MGRILVDLPDAQIDALAVLVEAEEHSRDAFIRDAIDAYFAHRKRVLGVDVFGLWRGEKADGLGCQQALRSEW